MVKAGQTGILLADIVSRTESSYILCGHSLGARVIYYALQSLKSKETVYIDRGHLLGGAVNNSTKEWDEAVTASLNWVNNYYSNNDWVLATFYKVGSFLCNSPIGRNPINSKSNKLQDFDVSNVVDGHAAFKTHFNSYGKV